jgi:hypothetical protein
MIPNFLEKTSVDEANSVDLDRYTFMERLSAQRGVYCFKIRECKRDREVV